MFLVLMAKKKKRRLSTAAESYLPTKDMADPQTDMYILYSLLSVGITVVLNLQVRSTQVNVCTIHSFI